MAKIRSVLIKNFRSIVELEVNAQDLTIIVGDNDSGKSNILRALNLFFNGHTNPDTPFNFTNDYNRYAEVKEKKAAEIVIELRIELPASYRENNGDYIHWSKRWRSSGLSLNEIHGVRLKKKKRGSGFIEEKVDLSNKSRVRPLLNKIRFEYVPAVRSADFFKNLRGRIFQVIAQATEGNVRASSGALENVIVQSVSDLLSSISTELNDNSKLSLPNDLTAIFESLDFLSGEKLISLDNRGDGIKARYIPLILKFIAEQGRARSGIATNYIWGYEEPENNLEFKRAQELSESFKKLAESDFSQVILTTHSPVFYNMHLQEDCVDFCNAYHVAHHGVSIGTTATLATETVQTLDESMGVMTIIAPYIQGAQKALAEAVIQAENLQVQIERMETVKPTLFVEGSTEHLIYQNLIDRFRPHLNDKIFLAEPPKRAGANYVANMLRSWEYRIKHCAKDQRVRAAGIVDRDDEGIGACERFKDESTGFSHVKLWQLDVPNHLDKLYAEGIKIPVCLEECWPQEYWELAEQSGWLIDRPKKNIFSEHVLQKLVDQDLKFSEYFDPAHAIYFHNVANPDVNTHIKKIWAEHMISLHDDELETAAASILKMLDKVAKDLLPKQA
ncbi:ATP-dependent nuclease [Pseudomonas turukhanskensis]|uniref:Endonuclease GajA/Old nuclease/RecF-like AAA domain-containing protein n=1 Tax=Pseudomonas turukhanskensis TaxID=1806536 RepID=A0A9W6K9T7_9PSED|nr:AAA family ATPase [Pseudomonas turukhanskensis]GLK91597.1 hypothetical protein GCM10017655_46610 [Pseudomonas turukhanskensis]